jgi:hypothetical protein
MIRSACWRRPMRITHGRRGSARNRGRYPKFAARLIELDALIVLPPKRRAQLWAVGERFNSPEFVNTLRRFVEGNVLADEPGLAGGSLKLCRADPSTSSEDRRTSRGTKLFGCSTRRRT